MAKKRINELSAELNVTNKEVIDFLRAHNVDVTSHMNAIEDDAIKMVNDHFGKKKAAPIKNAASSNQAQRPLRRPSEGQAQASPVRRQMLSGPEEKKQLMQKRQMADGPRNGQPQRRMLDGPEEKRQLMQKRQMLNGPQDRKNYSGEQRANRSSNRPNGPRTINGVVISSDDGDNRLIHGSYMSESELEAIKREKVKENRAKREAEKREAEKKAVEEAAKADELVAMARKEAEAIERNIEAQKAKAEKIEKAERVEKAEKIEKTEKSAATTNDTVAAPKTEAVTEKVFKTVGDRVRPNIIKRAGADGVNRANMGEKRPQNGERKPFNNDRRNSDRQGGMKNGNGNRNTDRNHFQTVESRYDGNNRGHSNLFENKNQRSYGSNQGPRDNNGNNGNNRGRNSGFSTRPQGFGGGKDEDD
ncbi:MAG: translation initiation factor IF-2 N-terminal domain-containing protein, partial [Lachnospiraceae bacterium]|nr:translation initiation factor IF-2 N-terminal domain-containing protein [Lachnospiraceae bacterium]